VGKPRIHALYYPFHSGGKAINPGCARAEPSQ
jgi:hypothetical protein